MSTPSETYIKAIEADYRNGNATELTYRNALEAFMESLGHGIAASSEPKHIQCGAPDFVIEKGKVPLGYVETKDLGLDLDKVEKSDQMKRYLKALSNLILTDYLEFRWYVNGERKMVLRIADVEKNGHFSATHSTGAMLETLLRDFYATVAPTVTTPKELAVRLAGVTHFIRDQIIAALNSGDPDLQKTLNQQYAAFVDLLLPELKPEEFADLYAQAITYGLFAAKLSAPSGTVFTFEDAYKYLQGNPFLRKLFMDVNEQIDEMAIIQPYLKDIVSLLNRADFASILADFGHRTRTEDPVVHFYETFLATYDPKLREKRGVYYTPEPVVQFIVRSVDELLKTRFDKPWGLADDSVKVLDPASGTGTFLYYVIQQIHDELVNKRHQGGQWPEKSKEMLKRIFGFELLLAPYVVSHLKLGLELGQLGAPLQGKDERVHIYLTNTLEQGIERAEMLAGLGLNIAQESNEAAKVKKADDIMVVLGNPPYSGNSANASRDKNGKFNFIGKLLNDYYFVDGAPLGERNPKWLQDDYVKFIRFGEWRIDKTGHGILAFITNHGYLDNPTFRGMRQHLMNTFDEIYVLDLHGNSKKKEIAPEGVRDENVFDIQQGVAIFIGIKNLEKARPVESHQIRYAEIWGSRIDKYEELVKNNINSLEWINLQPDKPFYLFSPQTIMLRSEYQKWPKITDIFPINILGFQTHRDSFAVDYEYAKIINRFSEMRESQLSDDEFRRKYDLNENKNWNLGNARKLLRGENDWRKYITKCAYRPFDDRFVFLNEIASDRPRNELVQNVSKAPNLCLLSSRQQANIGYRHCWVTDKPANDCVISTTSREANQVFPLYLYTTPEQTRGTLFAQSETTRRPNLAPEFISEFSRKLGLGFLPDGQGDLKTTFGPEDIFYYTYAVFHSPTYRSRYAEFLKIDFPRLPLTSDKALFARLVPLGKELVELHLLKSPTVENFVTSYPVRGENKVEKVALTLALSQEMGEGKKEEGVTGNVWINKEQYFGGVPEEVWNFKIGGYQVCEKWLKDRKGRTLSGEEISHYQRVVVALKETIRLMGEIDQAIPKWPIE
jgi:hypothetical protein